MHYVYILHSKESSRTYVGYTNNLKRRMSEHAQQKVHSTARYKQPSLIFYEAFLSKEDAMRRERYLKTSKGKAAIKLMARESLNL